MGTEMPVTEAMLAMMRANRETFGQMARGPLLACLECDGIMQPSGVVFLGGLPVDVEYCCSDCGLRCPQALYAVRNGWEPPTEFYVEVNDANQT